MSIIIVGVGQAEFDGKATDGPIPPPLSSPCVPGAGEGGWGGTIAFGCWENMS